MNRSGMFMVIVPVLICLAFPALTVAQDKQLGEAVFEHISRVLRTELALDDEQTATVMPLLREQAQLRTELRKERMKAARALRRALAEGASDQNLQQQLDRMDEFEQQGFRRQRELQRRIDGPLNTTQRIKLRFAAERIRREVQDRLRDVRERGDLRRGR